MKLKINYGINRRVRKGRKIRTEHRNDKCVIEAQTRENWSEITSKMMLHVAQVHPGWTLTGYAVVGVALDASQIEALMLVEWGFRAHEKGHNLEMTLDMFRRLYFGEFAVTR